MAKNQALRTISGRRAKAVKDPEPAPGIRPPVFRLPQDGSPTVPLADFARRKPVGNPMQIVNRSSQIPGPIAVSVSKLLTLIK
jgi:hypothetical protein